MRILTTYSHQTRMHNFGRFKGHEFFIPPSEAKWTDSAEGDYKFCYPNEEIPDNLHYDDVIEDPDLRLGVGGDVNILHDLGTKYDKDALNIYQTETQLVMNPPQNEKWMLIHHGVNTNRFKGWKGGGKIVTLFNNLFGRSTTIDRTKEYAEELKREFGDEFKIYGKDNEDGYIPHEKVDKTLRECSLFLHIRTRGFAPFNVAEALCTGCPVIAAPNPTASDDIIPGYNGIITDKIISAIKKLLKDEKNRRALGRRARRLGTQRFNLERNLAKWNYAFGWGKSIKDSKGD